MNELIENTLVITSESGDLVTTSLIIAEGTNNQHKAVIQLVRMYLVDLEEFGRVTFEMAPFETAGGVQKREIALLNERQATFFMTLLRNNEITVAFKKRLVKVFYEMAEQIRKNKTTFDPNSITRLDLCKMLVEAEEARLALEAKVEEDKPKVEYHDNVTDSTNCQTVQEVAKILNIGPNIFSKVLRQEKVLMKNGLPYQVHINAGRLRVVQGVFKDFNGENRLYSRSLFTGKGIIWIQKVLENRALPTLKVVTSEEVKEKLGIFY